MALESESKRKKNVSECVVSLGDKFYTTHKPSMEENMHFFLDEQ